MLGASRLAKLSRSGATRVLLNDKSKADVAGQEGVAEGEAVEKSAFTYTSSDDNAQQGAVKGLGEKPGFLVGLVPASVYKAFTGRLHPKLLHGDPLIQVDQSDLRLAQVYALAEGAPSDAHMQNSLYRSLSERGMHEEVVARFKSNTYAADESTVLEVMKSAILTNQLADISFSHARQTVGGVGYGNAVGSSANNPLHVTGLASGAPPGGVIGTVLRFAMTGAIIYLVYKLVFSDGDDGGFSLGGASSNKSYRQDNKSDTGSKEKKKKEGGGLLGRLMPGNEDSKLYDQAVFPTVTFADVIGQVNAKTDLEEVVSFLKDPERFEELGGKFPKGLLMVGPPGTGKTLLAKAVAGEAGVPFFYANGSEFDEMFVGVGPKRVRNLFKEARENSPCIVFIDEIDAMGGKRNSPSLNNTHRQTLNQLLTEMDGFQENSDVFVLAATNLPEVLDKALLRPGRFDRTVKVERPLKNDRLRMLQFYGKKIKLGSDVDFEKIARGTPGTTGAELAHIVNSAAIHAASHNQTQVTHEMMEWSKDKVLMGATSDLNQDEEARKLTAFHEGGHALVAYYSDAALPIYKATIVPRGQALGMVMQLPEGDKFSNSRREMVARMDVCMGGRVAEELIFGKDYVTSGASSDLEQATSIARSMVLKYGMGARTGLTSHDSDTIKTLSQSKRNEINDDIDALLNEAYARAQKMLTDKKGDLTLLADALLEHETLDLKEIGLVLSGKKLVREPEYNPRPPVRESTPKVPEVL